MEYLEVATRRGPVSVAGRLHSSPRVTLLIVTGSFPPAGFRHEFIDEFPGVSVLVANLPGMRCTGFAKPTADAFAAAFDEMLGVLAPPPAPVIVHGVSTGCLASLGMRAENIVRHIAEEPFLHTERLWPLVENFGERMRDFPDNEYLKVFLWNLFGYSPAGQADRDYRHLLDGLAVPIDIIVADEPLLPKRELPAIWPSLTGEADRALLASLPGATMHIAPPGSGHALILHAGGAALIRDVTRQAIISANQVLYPRR